MRPSLSLEERFWAKVDKTSTCWIWTASCRKGGYGQFWNGSRLVQAHRFSYELEFGSIPHGWVIDHVWLRGCLDPRCVNPGHLEAVTRAENTRRGTCGDIGRYMQRQKTYCKHGHPFSGDNLRIAVSGQRICRACCRVNSLKSKRKIS